MANKNTDLPSYMDGISVKIAEKYKPPKRIILPTNTQRLTANDILHNPFFSYDFSLENLIKTKMKELREARVAVEMDRDVRIKKFLEQKKNQQVSLQVRENDSSDIISDIKPYPNTDTMLYPNMNNISSRTHSTTNDMSVGDVTTTGTVLMPMTLANHSQSSSSHSSCDTPASTPINISDFENDTASPFDNMELKTLNDLAELAQVLQPIITSPSNIPLRTNANVYGSNFDMSVGDFNRTSAGLANIPTNDNRINGFYSNKFFVSHSQNYDTVYHQSPHNYVTESQLNTISPPQSTPDDSVGTTTYQSVPNIINALEKQLMHSRLDVANAELKQFEQVEWMQKKEANTKLKQLEQRGQSPSNNISHHHMKREIVENKLPNPYSTLPARQQQICKEVSLMGFPLDRVARACETIGDDQSRLIEHMIAMSQLLDLGFKEENVTKALVRCDNDRDKALDYLVS